MTKNTKKTAKTVKPLATEDLEAVQGGGSANVVFGDGSVRFIRDNIDSTALEGGEGFDFVQVNGSNTAGDD